ncbi:exonuclease SbcD [Tolumonas osonensis]|uniref:Nuclease SbcCD subunit D n=1 Tax=Tolumonas osonensis TaxID=675874 RepID=A0A841GL34_9GAMM|nr:exonuclease SbcCD subunit D C-terminal domain-containing protein [Tolumonas osonensis]MBB6056025.1 exonuclease SbcD [Tolumonas osonensis]
MSIVKLLHTADWHLGHRLHGHERYFEHRSFLDWLLHEISERDIDGLLVAGDIFDTANPSATSWQLFYQFLATLRQQRPHLNVIIIAGNHDSPSKLDAPHELLRSFDLHLIGAIERDADGKLNSEKLVIPLKDRTGAIRAWCAAVPFLRSADLRLSEELQNSDEDRLVAGVAEVYQQVFACINAQRTAGQPVLAMGHAYLQRGELSELSERKVLGGNQHALPLSVFNGADYVALGHLHLAQSLSEQVHYAGSPLPLSLAEQHYPHQLIELTVTDNQISVSDKIRIPTVVDILRIPATPAPLDDVLAELNALSLNELPHNQQPFLEVRVRLEKPEARLRERILAVLADKPVRLARIHIEYSGHGLGMADQMTSVPLDSLSAKEVFALCYQRQYASSPDEDLLGCFEELETALENVAS